jgi:hypothetical protein
MAPVTTIYGSMRRMDRRFRIWFRPSTTHYGVEYRFIVVRPIHRKAHKADYMKGREVRDVEELRMDGIFSVRIERREDTP